MTNDFNRKDARRNITILRKNLGADTPAGRRCSNLLEQLEVYPKSTAEQRLRMELNIAESIAELAELTGGR